MQLEPSGVAKHHLAVCLGQLTVQKGSITRSIISADLMLQVSVAKKQDG
ncbi:ATP-binding protein [Enterovibrio makurazakiensis]